jgi:MFS family permease
VRAVQINAADVRRIAVIGAIVGGAIGGTIATIVDGRNGPVFWAGVGVGLVIGPVCLVALSMVAQRGRMEVRRRSRRRLS